MKSEIEQLIKQDIDLSSLTTFCLGGPAKHYLEAKTKEELSAAIVWAKERSLPIFILGGGSNLLVSSKGFDGLVIKLQNRQLSVDGREIRVGAGAGLPALVMAATDNGLSGLEWAAGIPGTIGGAIRGNAGAYGGEIKDSLVEAEVYCLTDDIWESWRREDFNFSYRGSRLKTDKTRLVWLAVFSFTESDIQAVRAKIIELTAPRRGKLSFEPSAGCIFKNLPVEALSDEALIRFSDQLRFGKLPAGIVVEELGFKGRRSGGALVSPVHANFIVNTGDAKPEEVLALINEIKTAAFDELGLRLDTEIEMLGF